jgi:hypothetical protein
LRSWVFQFKPLQLLLAAECSKEASFEAPAFRGRFGPTSILVRRGGRALHSPGQGLLHGLFTLSLIAIGRTKTDRLKPVLLKAIRAE